MYESLQKANSIDTLKMRVYMISVGSLYVLYVVLFLGLFYVNPTYVHWLSSAVHLAICIFLLFRFHPFKKHDLRPFDSTIIFGCALFLFINIVITDIGVSYIEQKLGFSGKGFNS